MEKHVIFDHSLEHNNVVASACAKCNMKMQDETRVGVPIVFHNASHYDWKFILSGVGNYIDRLKDQKQNFKQYPDFKALAHNSENTITFRWCSMLFIDSFKFLSFSLNNIIRTLTSKAMELAKDLYKRNGITDEEKIAILCKKGEFPYLWFDRYEKLFVKALPEMEHFGSEESYKNAVNAWNILGCETFEDYHDMYLTTDVILLATVFQTFRKNIYERYSVDPAYHLGIPMLSWDLALKSVEESGYQIELFTKQEDYLLFQNSLQGGIVQVCQRYAKKNDNTQIQYFDVNGLYGTILGQKKLPCRLLESKEYSTKGWAKSLPSQQDTRSDSKRRILLFLHCGRELLRKL